MRDDVGTISQTDFTYTFQRNLPDVGLMDYKARFYSPRLVRFIQPDSIIPSPANPQSWNRYSYVGNSPINFSDPSGHRPACGVFGEECESDELEALTGNGGGGGGENGDDEVIDENNNNACTTYHYQQCSDTNLYLLGWENFGSAWSIFWHPNATMLQRFGAGYYMSVWGSAHAAIVVGSTVAAIEYLVPGAISCGFTPGCKERVFWTGGELAKDTATAYARANNGITVNQTLYGRWTSIRTMFMDPENARILWERASAKFAEGTSGSVHAFINFTEYIDEGVYNMVEVPILINNPYVTNLIETILH